MSLPARAWGWALLMGRRVTGNRAACEALQRLRTKSVCRALRTVLRHRRHASMSRCLYTPYSLVASLPEQQADRVVGCEQCVQLEVGQCEKSKAWKKSSQVKSKDCRQCSHHADVLVHWGRTQRRWQRQSGSLRRVWPARETCSRVFGVGCLSTASKQASMHANKAIPSANLS